MLGALLALVLVAAVQGRLADYGDSRTSPQYDDDVQRDYTARDRDDMRDNPQETSSDFDYKYEEESPGATKLPDRENYDMETSQKSKLHNPSYVDSNPDIDSYNSYEDASPKPRKSRPRGKPKAENNDYDGADVEIKLNRYNNNNYPNDDRDEGYSAKRKLPCPRVKYVDIESKIECQPGKTYDNRPSRKKHRPRLKTTESAFERRKPYRKFKDERHKFKAPPEEKDGIRMELDEEAIERILVEEHAKGGDDNGKPDRRPPAKDRCHEPEFTTVKDKKKAKEEEEDNQYYDMKILFRIKDRFPGLQKKAKLEPKAIAHSTVKPNESDDLEVILGNYRDRKKSDNQFQQLEANTNATLSLLAQGAVEPGMQEEWKAFLASFNFSAKSLQVSTCTILLALLNCLQIYNQLFSLSIY